MAALFLHTFLSFLLSRSGHNHEIPLQLCPPVIRNMHRLRNSIAAVYVYLNLPVLRDLIPAVGGAICLPDDVGYDILAAVGPF